jgi:hypothetical protein
MQSLGADPMRGKRVRLSGYQNTEGVTTGWAGLGMFASRRDLILKYENMEDLGVRGSTDWQRYEITMDVPRGATQIRFAVLLHGKGKLWADDLKLELLDEAGQARPLPGPWAPRNLEFEEGAGDNSVRLWDVASGRLKAILPAVSDQTRGLGLLFAPDGRTLAISRGDGTVRLWDAEEGDLKATLGGQALRLWALAFSPDSRWLAAAGSDHAVRLWDVRTGQARAAMQGHQAAVIVAAFSRDGKILATRDGSHTARLWDVATGKQLPLPLPGRWTGFPPRIALPVSMDNKMAVSLHDPRDGRVLATLLPVPEAASEAAKARPIELGAKPIESDAEAPPLPGGNEWFVTTPEGYFDCSANAARFIRWNVNGVLYPVERYLRRFRRPDLVRRALRGERVTAPEISSNDIPPAAQFAGLDHGDPVPSDPMSVTIDVSDDRDVKEVELLVNGRPLPPEAARPILLDARPIELGSKVGDPYHRVTHRFHLRVPLPLGAEEIHLRAVAYDDTDLGSDPVEIVLRRTGVEPVPGHLYVLSVGVSRYRHADGRQLKNLRFPAQDARAVAARFQREGKPLYEQVRVRTLTDEQATLANVRNELEWLQASVRPGQIDTVVLFLSGHGISVDGRYYFATHDMNLLNLPDTVLSGQELREALGGRLRAKAVFLFVDTCHAGGLTGRNDDLLLELGDKVYPLVSSGATEYSYESPAWGHGAFTLALLRALEKRELAPRGVLHFNALIYAVPEEVARLMVEAGRNENEQQPSVPFALPRLRVPIAQPLP